MAEQISAKSPNVYSCSLRVVGGSPSPMVLRDHCRNCSVRLNPPYSVHLQAPALRPRTTRLLTHACGNRSAQALSNEAARRVTFGQPLRIDGSEDIGKLAIPLQVFEQFIEHGHGRHTTWCLCGRCISCEDPGSQPISNRQF